MADSTTLRTPSPTWAKLALQFVNERRHLPYGDLDRAENQRAVNKAIQQRGLSGSALADPVRSLRLVCGLAQQVGIEAAPSSPS